jgi:hypothetical protein
LALLNILIWVSIALPYVGVRQKGMSDAFMGLADDAYVTYWNPAGIAFSSNRLEIAYSGIIHSRSASAYDDFLSVVFPSKYGGLGIAIMSESGQERWLNWLILSLGLKMTDQVSAGFNLRLKKKGIKRDQSNDSANYLSVDSAIFGRLKNVSWGLLLQNVNTPEYWLIGKRYKYFINVRPGLSIKTTQNLLISFEVYDLLQLGQPKRTYRIGLEYKIFRNIFLRTGIRRLNMSEREIAFGMGYILRWFKKVCLQLDYALFYQREAEKTTHFAGLS